MATMTVLNGIVYFIILIFSVVIHEVSHGYAAYRNGDNTAFLLGRLTLNPIPHLDPFGSILLPLVLYFMHLPIIGYAKPVPINPLRFRNYKKGIVIVGLSGCAANLAFGSFAALLCRFVSGPIGSYLFFAAFLNFLLMFFNLIPIPPLDGSRVLAVFLPFSAASFYDKLERYGIFIIYFLLFVVGFRFLGEASGALAGFIAGAGHILNF